MFQEDGQSSYSIREHLHYMDRKTKEIIAVVLFCLAIVAIDLLLLRVQY